MLLSVTVTDNLYLLKILMNVRKKLIPARSSQGVKTRMVAMIARVEMDFKGQRKEHAQVIHYTSFYFTLT